MIPISDELRRRHFPIINLTLILITTIVFIYELTLSGNQLQRLIMSLGAIPEEIVAGRDIPPPGPHPLWLTLITSMFLHGGWFHFGGNMLYLWVFGDNVEDALGKIKYLFLYLASGIIAGGAQILSNPNSTMPSIGASGAIAGVLGAYLLLYPRARVETLVAFGFFITLIPVPAILLIGLWAVMQFFNGIASLGIGVAQTSGVAYWAHVGGFVAGLVLVSVLRRRL
ncbi:MAG: rhomboid family intramembrane serine protease [Chloroflexi bacterium]|nr:rhomboid family intramembrane serine protease [Chloroflexota bacterium]